MLDSNSTPMTGAVVVHGRWASMGEDRCSSAMPTAASSMSCTAFYAESVAPGSGTGINADSVIQTQTAHYPVSAPEMAAAESTASITTNVSTIGVSGNGTLTAAGGVASTAFLLGPYSYLCECLVLLHTITFLYVISCCSSNYFSSSCTLF